MWRGRFSTFVDGAKNFPELGFEPQHFEKFRHLPNFVILGVIQKPRGHNLLYFDHLPTLLDIFYVLNVGNNGKF